ncbi:hypothetical protein GJ744_000699 [Endocarpon pusillum]|uniref:F-box domain-containing protein n=1 Tax=Endocarpon pusillum TaxID=364733 RepID=A0A8H7AEC9_9EURO|nr:hypothetical protein GJ744_000699 [Endocarpon pusillum]
MKLMLTLKQHDEQPRTTTANLIDDAVPIVKPSHRRRPSENISATGGPPLIMAKKSINDVPVEILRSILAHFRSSGTLAEFVLCLRVCQKWKDVGTPLAWGTLVLDKKKMERLLLSALQYNHPFNAKAIGGLEVAIIK